jgi:hypothetical protein
MKEEEEMQMWREKSRWIVKEGEKRDNAEKEKQNMLKKRG